jgi:hypothetical protein
VSNVVNWQQWRIPSAQDVTLSSAETGSSSAVVWWRRQLWLVRSNCPCKQLKHQQQQNMLTLLVLQEVLSAGQGWLHRAAESGQLVFDRVRHADVLEYLWWLTRYMLLGNCLG